MRIRCWLIRAGLPVFLFFSILPPLSAQTAYGSSGRSFNEIFPGLPAAVREAAFSSDGYYKTFKKAPLSALAGSGQDVIDHGIIETGFLVESILVIPGRADQYSLLDVYNALGKVRGLKGHPYHSHTRNETVPLFEEVTRIESAKKNTPVEDPPPASRIPPSETMYMRLKDVNFGNTYYRGDISLFRHGLRYTLSNNRNINYLFLPVIKEGKFTAQIYFEPISEGILIYSVTGADVSDFVSSRIDMVSAISKRLAVIINWVTGGITGAASS